MKLEFSKAQKIAYIALLIALEVVLGRFAGVMTPVVSINFSFLPLAVNAIVFGPVAAAFSAAAADVIGALLLPKGLGTFFPGFTLSAALNGLIYGLFLYRKPRRMWRVASACLATGVFIGLGLSTYWVYMMTGQGFVAIMPARVLQTAVMLPTRVFVIWLLAYRVAALIWKGHTPES